MSTKSVLKELPGTLKLGLPIALGMLSHMLIQLTDTILLGHYGTNELAAAAFSGSIILLLLYVGLGFGQAINVLCSQSLGAQDPKRARGIYHLSSIGGFIYAAVGVLLTLWMLPSFDHMHQPAIVASLSKPFAILLAFSFIPTIAFQNLRTYYESLKRPYVPFYYMLGLLVLNIFLNWVLIFGKFGMPAMGIIGSGLGTLLARTIIAVLFFINAYKKGEPLYKGEVEGWQKQIPYDSIRRILTISTAHGLQMIVTMLAYVVGGVWVGTLGAAQLAANRMIGTWDATLYMIPLGLGAAMSIRIGRAKGAGDIALARTIYRGGFWVTAIFCGIVSLSMVAFPQAIIGWFTNDAAAVAVATQIIFIAALFNVFDNLASITLASLRGLGDIVVPALSYLAIYWILAMPLAYNLIFTQHMGTPGLWWGFCLGIVLGAVFLVSRFLVVTRQMIALHKKPLMEVEEPAAVK